MKESNLFSTSKSEDKGLPTIYFIARRRRVTDQSGTTLTWIQDIYAGKYDTDYSRIDSLCEKLNESNTVSDTVYRVLELDAATDKEMEMYLATE